MTVAIVIAQMGIDVDSFRFASLKRELTLKIFDLHRSDGN
jgi:hypothetical protein